MKQITKTELENMYRHNSNQEVCQMLGVSLPTLLSYLKEFGIVLKGKGNSKTKIELINE
jgi:hypothetical protein